MDFDEFDIFGQRKLPHQEFTRIFILPHQDIEIFVEYPKPEGDCSKVKKPGFLRFFQQAIFFQDVFFDEIEVEVSNQVAQVVSKQRQPSISKF
jgi:hypothetical protein